MKVKELPGLEQYGITAVSRIGETGRRGKGIIYATRNAPIIPLNRWEYPEFVNKLPRNTGWQLIQKIYDATEFKDLMPIIKHLEQFRFKFHIHSIPTTPPIELILFPKGSRFIINAVEYGRAQNRILLYSSFRTTQRMLILLIAGNIF